ncbi:OmcA/MtrC family decaheme c-type cytochrome [Shewanella atlantica]|uniref:OmcA/MtrC family decaheme c-type cytochrome n=1 Tax=Shewanella atlantica TaxID=271099 RepID=A0A3S0IG92_9GAMM|nr:OmcA/MtrC family decaheme c-type cytochrome [Shewanella atlantica]RTR33198.1 OmcA/MtrC family decaheme c-type cytochrome [Shewanella atlantica]
MNIKKMSLLAWAIAGSLSLSACGGDDGTNGVDGADGITGLPGTPGLSAGDFSSTVENAADLMMTLEPADIVVTGSEPFRVRFSAKAKNSKGEMVPYLGLDKISLLVMNQAENITDTGAPYLWYNHAMTNDSGYYMYCTLDGKATGYGGAEVEACTLTEDTENLGTYFGSWEHDGNAPIVLADGDANNLHRVIIRSYHVANAQGVDLSASGNIMSTPFDFIPATGEFATSVKDTVSNEACIQCHGELEGFTEDDSRIGNIKRHHNFQNVESCVVCHNPALGGGQNNREKGFNANFAPMVHTIHAGHHIEGDLTGQAKEKFGEIGFPSKLSECTTCHEGTTSWNDNIYAEACVGCHVTVNFETGEGHSEFNLAQADDSQCTSCHGVDNLSPMKAHSVGVSKMVSQSVEAALNSVTYTEGVSDDLTVTLDVKFNGLPVVDGFDFGDFAVYSSVNVGIVDANGTVTKKSAVDFAGAKAVAGKITASLTGDLNFEKQSIYLASRLSLCADKTGELADCAKADLSPLPVTMQTAYWNLAKADGSDANVARFSQTKRITADEAKCNTCHDSLAYVEHAGALEFDQCMNCHNETWAGSYHPDVEQKQIDEVGNTVVDTDGKPIFVAVEGLHYYTRDLFAVAHRFHSGQWDDNRGFPPVHRNTDNGLEGFPAIETQCAACHKDGVKLFAADGGLTSGKRALAVTDDNPFAARVTVDKFISPVAEACRTCHAHSDEAAYAHFISNGATVIEDGATTANLPVESCATCHAEGKTYGIDKVHAGGAH